MLGKNRRNTARKPRFYQLFKRVEYIAAWCAVLPGSRGQYKRLSDAVLQSVSTAGRRRLQFSDRHVADVLGCREAVADDQRSATQRRRRD